MKVKTGILSMQRIANYGSFLQAYGLKRLLEELGCQVEFVDYHPGQCLIKSDDGNGFVRKVKKTLEVFRCKAPLGEKLRFIRYKKDYAANYYPYLGISTDKMNYTPKLDMLIIGSDEVFNCVQDNANVGFTPELFGVGNRAGKVISYGASFGNTTLEKLEKYNVKDQVSGWLGVLSAVSVRDANSGAIVRELTGREPVYHLDPVLAFDFLEKCKEIPDHVAESGYMILYGYSGRFTEEECRVIRAYARDKHIKIFCIGGVQHCCDKFIDCSPFQVIAYFKNAECVVTDTFHGTILSVITHQRFASFVRNQGYGNCEKLTDLLRRLKLENCIVTDIHDMGWMLDNRLDYGETDKVIKAGRESAREYLSEQLRQ